MSVFVEKGEDMSDSLKFRNVFLSLCERCEKLDCKKYEIPVRIGISYSIYKSIIEYGKLPKPKILIRIADFFEVSLEYLLGRTGEQDFIPAPAPSSFWERYELLKSEKHLTDYRVAQKLHVSTSYTTNWKKLNFLPSLDNLIILSEIFKVSLDYLLGRTDYRN